ncbi:MAG: peptidoglycan DD-metalloendopeptidase family protein [Burkholderiaceae bacterium]
MTSISNFRWAAVLPIVAMAACVSQRPAPVVDRSGRGAATAQASAQPASPATREAKDGIYIAQRGDTLYGVALAFGVDQRDLERWNGIVDGAPIRPGQTLRVIPPTDVAVVSPIPGSGTPEVRQLPMPGAASPAPSPAPLPPSPTAPAPPLSAPPPAATPAPSEAPRTPSSALPWQWPTAGKVVETFDDPRNKGIDIAGVEGAAVQAAADGEVVYVGSAVRGYGNLVIVRHSDEFITAYAHNRKVLVAEKQPVKRGQTIAELGRSDADRPKLHFEIRHQGKPVDPLKYLPAR